MSNFDGLPLEEQIKLYSQQMITTFGAQSGNPPMPVVKPTLPPPVTEPAPPPPVVTPTPPPPVTEPAPPPPPVSATPGQTTTPAEEYRLFSLENPQRGSLRVQALTARSTYPVPDVRVVISKRFASGDYSIATLTTDNAGHTEGVAVPAPDRSLSEHPEEGGKKPFADYQLTFTHPKFTTVLSTQPVFAGETAIQVVNLTPLPASPGGATPIEYITTEPSDL